MHKDQIKKIKRNLWETTEFESWAGKNELIREEQELFEKYLVPLDKDSKILDVGTGNGRFLFRLAELGFKELWGIDLAEKLLSIARLP